MKKLNRKGFTLIELLAVVVILAIVLVVTIPSVLSSIDKAREKSFSNALDTIEDFVGKQYGNCILHDTAMAPYNTSILTTSCALQSGYSASVLSAMGYTDDIQSVTIDLNGGNPKVTAATGKGQFAGYSKS